MGFRETLEQDLQNRDGHLARQLLNLLLLQQELALAINGKDSLKVETLAVQVADVFEFGEPERLSRVLSSIAIER